ncbi:hypothetical protein [Phaeocystidibacter marisrubri]|uniref:M23 family metallopeptidase n=1 Tax=Phaeocystidibacter marisrubri TaxID=1577780 RepID=A0A6L3ZFB6_9FLAO|nr:hypothetical protein [Phaeocystidibacter marisrubri]KAB2816248.1 hypothetical protein F8C82_11210 [Phaeocystidibacter marisrubri]GGH68056.1 hypothetical protein GCM10011318_07700 [Phaeocystidibacter marisrubri]
MLRTLLAIALTSYSIDSERDKIEFMCPLEHGSISMNSPIHPFLIADPSESFLFTVDKLSNVYPVFSGVVVKLDTIESNYLFVLTSDSMYSAYFGRFDPSLIELGKHYNIGETITKAGKGTELIVSVWENDKQLYKEVEFNCSN